MTMKFRPKGGDSRFYQPDRDIAYCFPTLFSAALRGLEEENWEAWYGNYLRAKGCGFQQLYEAAGAFAQGFKLLASKPSEYPTPQHAFEASEFFKTNPAAQLVIAAKLGQICIGAFFYAVCDETQRGDAAPDTITIAEIVAAATELADKWKQRAEEENGLLSGQTEPTKT